MSEAAVRFLVLGVQDWPLVAAGVPPEEPAVILGGNRVQAASAAARAEGVTPGLRRRDAQARCPQVAIVADDPLRDVRVFEPVVAAVADLCPQLAVLRPGWCGFPTRGPSRYFGGDEALATRVRQVARDTLGTLEGPSDLEELGASRAARTRDQLRDGARRLVGVGVADGQFTAELAATAVRSSAAPRTWPAQDMDHPLRDAAARTWGHPVRDLPPAGAPPPGTPAQGAPEPPEPLVVPPGASPRWLAPQPVAVLARRPDGHDGPVASDLVELFHRLGLTTLGAVAALPAGDLLARFGPAGDLAHRLASGLDDQPARLVRLPEDLAVEAGFDPPLDRVDQLAFAVRPLTEEFQQALAHRGEVCTRLTVIAETEHGERRERGWRHGASTTTAALADQVRWQIDSWLQEPVTDRPTAGVVLLRLVAEEVVAATGTQLRLWDTSDRGPSTTPDRVLRAVARLRHLLGPEAVRIPRWQGGRHPDTQVTLVPADTVDLTGPHPDDTRPPVEVRDPDRPPWPGRLPVPSPATVLADDDRLPVDVVDAAGAPVQVSGRVVLSTPPAELTVGDRRQRIVAWAGPWPVTERWWEPSRRRRQARFQVVTEDGSAYLLVIDRGRWLLAAVYD